MKNDEKNLSAIKEELSSIREKQKAEEVKEQEIEDEER